MTIISTLSLLRRSSVALLIFTLCLFTNSLARAQSSTITNTNLNTNSNSNRGTNKNENASVPRNANNKKSNEPTKPNPCTSVEGPPSKVKDVYLETNTPATSSSLSSTAGNEATEYKTRIREVELGNVIIVEGDFKTLLAQAVCEKKNIVLYLEDRPLKDVTAYPPTDPSKPVLRFTLKRTEDSRDVWTYILGQPSWAPRRIKVSVGLLDKYAIDSDALLNLKVIPHGWFIFWVLLFVLLLGAFLIFAKRSNLLRDSGNSPGQGDRRPYSLARTQAAWWFFFVVASYLFIGMITGDFNSTITTTVLGLIGISAGTAIGSAMVDASKTSAGATSTNIASAKEIETR